MYLVYLKDPGKAILARVSSLQPMQIKANASLISHIAGSALENSPYWDRRGQSETT